MFNIFKRNKEHLPPYIPNPEEYRQSAEPVPENMRPLFVFAKVIIVFFLLLGFFISFFTKKCYPEDRLSYLLLFCFVSIVLSTVFVNLFISQHLDLFDSLLKKLFLYFTPVICLLFGVFIYFLIDSYLF